MARNHMLLAWTVLALASSNAEAQTTAGTGTTIVFPVTAQTGSFASEVTIFNPGPNALAAHVTFFEANNSSTPGTKVCTDASVPANRSVQFSIGTQCPLAAGSHFGLLVVADSANPQTNAFYGYTRVQNPAGIGFSVEGFPVQNFNNQMSHATGLKRQAASPTFQTNCFVGSLEQPVSYELKLFNDATGAQIGNTLTGSLNAFEQFRYLDVFGPNGVNAPAGDQFNVRAQFTQTSGGTANLIGFCTVQDNTSFGADFRIAKSYGSPSNSFFAQGGNSFGTTAKLGTLDNQPVEIYANNQRVMRYEPNADGPNVIGGHPNNSSAGFLFGQTIAGGGAAGNTCYDPPTGTSTRSCGNRTNIAYATVGGGVANQASGSFAIVAGGESNTASANFATVAGGAGNTASGTDATVAGGSSNKASGEGSTVSGGGGNTASGPGSTIAGGTSNTASGTYATVAGGRNSSAGGLSSFAAGEFANALNNGCFVWGDNSNTGTLTCLAPNEVDMRAMGGFYFVTGKTGSNYTGAQLPPGAGAWSVLSDRDSKGQFERVDVKDVLTKLAALPIAKWSWKSQARGIRHMGPMAQDFHAEFGLGENDTMISTVDADGVALAAIQGLHQLVQEKDARIAALELKTELQQRELAQLRQAVEALLVKMGNDAVVAIAR